MQRWRGTSGPWRSGEFLRCCEDEAGCTVWIGFCRYWCYSRYGNSLFAN